MQGEIQKTDFLEPQEGQQEKGHLLLDQFLESISQQNSAEAKLQFALESMEKAIAHTSSPNFKIFWEARRLCLDLFKDDTLPSNNRFNLWNRCVELSKEGYRLKSIFDEQSAFAAEQIEIAIKAIEDDVTQLKEKKDHVPPIEMPTHSKVLEPQVPYYKKTQYELSFLNAYASRINSLRKELIKTEMRIRNKNKLFQRLSIIGNDVFPRRKNLIKEVSDNFIQDVNHFIEMHFKKDKEKRSLFFLREEIKALQSIAKFLTLNTQAFSETRLRLSECWDEIKNLDKERKKERANLKDTFKENATQIEGKINEFRETFSNMTHAQADDALKDINTLIRHQKLGREEIQSLNSSFSEIRKLSQERKQKVEQERQQQELDKVNQRQRIYEDLKARIENLFDQTSNQEAEQIALERDRLTTDIEIASILKYEKQELEKRLKRLDEIIVDRKEEAILAFSASDKATYDQLLDVYNERLERRQQIKNQIEVYRKSRAASGLDFHQAIAYQEQIAVENQRLEKITQSIEEIEEKIEELKRSNE